MRIKLVALVNGHHLFVTSCVYYFIFFQSLSSSKSNLHFTWIVRRNRCQRPPITNITPIITRHPLKIYVHLWRRRQINVCLLCCIVRVKPQLNFWLSLSYCSPLSFTQCGSLTPAYSFVPLSLHIALFFVFLLPRSTTYCCLFFFIAGVYRIAATSAIRAPRVTCFCSYFSFAFIFPFSFALFNCCDVFK